jgi:hypothetical protein
VSLISVLRFGPLTCPSGNLVFDIFRALAERDLITEHAKPSLNLCVRTGGAL